MVNVKRIQRILPHANERSDHVSGDGVRQCGEIVCRKVSVYLALKSGKRFAHRLSAAKEWASFCQTARWTIGADGLSCLSVFGWRLITFIHVPDHTRLAYERRAMSPLQPDHSVKSDQRRGIVGNGHHFAAVRQQLKHHVPDLASGASV